MSVVYALLGLISGVVLHLSGLFYDMAMIPWERVLAI